MSFEHHNNSDLNQVIGSLEGRRFIIGREGHIYISDPAVSKEHAEMTIVGGKVCIRDLGSTNGIYYMRNDHPVRIREEVLQPEQTITIGKQRHTIQSLLRLVGAFTP